MAGQRSQRDRPITRASIAKEAANDSDSQKGGSGMRQSGSQRTCQSAIFSDASNSSSASLAGTLELVKTATKPTGTASVSSGTMNTLAEKPLKETRWK